MLQLSGQVRIFLHAHVLDGLKLIPDHSIQTVITSPPYWGMRRYMLDLDAIWPDGNKCAFGAEATPEQYVRRTADILSILKTKLRADSVVWWVIRDAYFTRTIIRTNASERLAALENRHKESWKDAVMKRSSYGHSYLKDKDLTMIPFLVALEAQKIGYWVRSIITWEKENLVPESKVDRPVLSHEHIIMLTTSKRYKWNADNAKEISVNGSAKNSRQLRSVWKIKPSTGRNGHPAPFPEELVERCISITTDEGDIVVDPFLGSGTTALVAERMSRKFVGIDVVGDYLDQAAVSFKTAFPNVEILRC